MAIPGETFEQPIEDREIDELEAQDQLNAQYGEELNGIDAKLEEKEVLDREIAKKAMETMNPEEAPINREQVEEQRIAEEGENIEKSA